MDSDLDLLIQDVHQLIQSNEVKDSSDSKPNKSYYPFKDTDLNLDISGKNSTSSIASKQNLYQTNTMKAIWDKLDL